jgi:hypothetical protein
MMEGAVGARSAQYGAVPAVGAAAHDASRLADDVTIDEVESATSAPQRRRRGLAYAVGVGALCLSGVAAYNAGVRDGTTADARREEAAAALSVSAAPAAETASANGADVDDVASSAELRIVARTAFYSLGAAVGDTAAGAAAAKAASSTKPWAASTTASSSPPPDTTPPELANSTPTKGVRTAGVGAADLMNATLHTINETATSEDYVKTVGIAKVGLAPHAMSQ